MNNINPVPNQNTLIDKSLRIARRKAEKNEQVLPRAANWIHNMVSSTVTSFPDMDDLDEYVAEMISLSFTIDDVKKSLGGVYSVGSIAQEAAKTGSVSVFVGRLSEAIEKRQDDFERLHLVRKEFRRLPTLLDTYRVALVGYPNTGKTSLLSDLTGADPDIQSYEFTTKYVNAGTMETIFGDVQILDTPGVLLRDDKRNEIEKRAFITARYAADECVVVGQDIFGDSDHQKVVEAFTYRDNVPVLYGEGGVQTVSELKKELISRLKRVQ